MIEEIKHFNKNASVIMIKEFFEQRFKVDLGYKAVYSEFRKIFPHLGPKDAEVFIKLCKERSFLVEHGIDEINRHETKFFICSSLMKFHYELYGDIVLVDSTYRG